jgi:DNA-binding beta-propeller fold protein YncE
MSYRHGRLGVPVAILLACLALAPSAAAAEGDPQLDQCFASSVVAPCTQIAPAFTGIDVELSPDGKHLYALGRNPSVVRLFDRGANNKLTPREGAAGCYNSGGTGGCTAVPGLVSGDVYDLDFAPDGKSIYVAASGSLAHLQRDPSTGALTPMTCYGTGSGCIAIAPVGSVYTVVVSKDGQNVYTRGGGTFGVFQRNPATGTLIPEPDGEDCFSEQPIAGCSDTYGLADNAFEMTFSPDGKFLYYPIQTPGGVGWFQHSANGTLTQISGPQGGCITTNGSSSVAGECATIADGSGPALSNGWAVTLSPSGAHLFASGSSGTVVFSRNQEDGKLTKVGCISLSSITACTQVKASAGMGVSVSPDGKRAIVDSFDVSGFGVYDFNPTTGTLTQLPGAVGCFSGTGATGCGVFPGGTLYGKIAWAPDGLNFYAVASGPLANMVQDYGPKCQSGGANIVKDLSAAVGLSCSDPNGDPVTLRISRGPTAGSLAEIDQAASSVRYNPFSGFVGTDSFAYQGVARGLASPEAVMTLNVQAPPPPPSQPPVKGTVKAGWKASKAATTATKLLVAGTVSGTRVELTCKGKGCPLKTKVVNVKKAGDQNLLGYFKGRRKMRGKLRPFAARLAPGAVVAVELTAPGSIGKRFSYTMRKGKQPSAKTACLAPGSDRPQAC